MRNTIGPFIPGLGVLSRVDKWWETQAQLLHIAANSLALREDPLAALAAKDARRTLVDITLECFGCAPTSVP